MMALDADVMNANHRPNLQIIFCQCNVNQRTNGPVNAHTRSAVYTNDNVLILWKIAPEKRQMKRQ